MTQYINIDENWGDRVPVGIEDYRRQAALWQILPEDIDIEDRGDGIYIDGEQVAVIDEEAGR